MMSLLLRETQARRSGGVDAVREVPDLLQDRELVLERQDLGDLAVPEVPDRRIADLDGLAGRRHAAIRAGVRTAPDESHGELVCRDEQVLDARGNVSEAGEPVADPADRSAHADTDTVGPEFLAEDVAGYREVPRPSLGEPPPGYLHVLFAGFRHDRARHDFSSSLRAVT